MRRTVDFGIDLGTTNSAIAVMERGAVRILQNLDHQDITPSVVRIDEKGNYVVGQNAYDFLYSDPANTAASFKLLMGTTQKKNFTHGNHQLKPEQLSAEILKNLKASVATSLPNEPELTAAVITVPCYFEMTQSQATLRAAQLAGIEFAPLLQEPIAASIAYGFLEKMPKGYWIVYDLGGGTFDVALLSALDGHLTVVDHGGDNYLGGNDFDWHIVQEIIYPVLAEEFDLPDLGRKPQYAKLNALLKYAAETAKINSTRFEVTEIVIDATPELKDRRGKPIKIRIPMTRQQMNAVISQDVDKSFRIMRDVLKRQNLSSADIGRMILVGGPTQIPYIKERLNQEFGILVDHFVDPMTVVARGAAIYAASQLLAFNRTTKSSSKLNLDLKYEPMTTSSQASVAGRVSAPQNAELPAVIKVQIRSQDGQWKSDMIEAKNNSFFISVLLKENQVNTFAVFLFDENEKSIPLESHLFTIHQGMSVGAPPLARSIGVELYDGSFDRLLYRGISLPAKATYTYTAARDLNPGQESEILEIPVREGESDRFDQNRHLGSLVIRGTDIHRKISVNSDIQVTLFIDTSRAVSAEAFIPALDQRFSMRIPNMTSPLPNAEDLAIELQKEEKRWKDLLTQASALGFTLGEVIVIVSGLLNEVRLELDAGIGGDAISIEKADRRIKELKGHIDTAQKAIHWPALLKEHGLVLADVSDTVEMWGKSGDFFSRLELLKKDGEKAVTLKDAKRLEKSIDDLHDLKWEILFQQKDFWIGAFQELKSKELSRFVDENRARDLIQEGTLALGRHDTDSVQSITIQLWKLISKAEQDTITQKINTRSGIKKRN